MSGRTDARPGDEPAEDPRRVAQAGRRSGEDTPSRDAEKAEGDKAKTEIEAGDVADDLADFA